jgi:heavy metal-binding protein
MSMFSRSGRVVPVQRILWMASLGVLAASCATEPPPRAVQLDPANPAAQESMPLEVSLADVGALARDRTAPNTSSGPAPLPLAENVPDAGAGSAAAPAQVYGCPMHPEVTSAKPGTCPKCGMRLVLKSSTPPPQGKPRHHGPGVSP